MESLKLNNYLEHLKARPKTKFTSRFGEIIEPYLKEFRWDDSSFFKDKDYLFVSGHRYLKSHTEYQLQELLRWASGKDLHIRQFLKALNK